MTHWSKEKVIERMKEMSDGVYAPSSKQDHSLTAAARRYFGKWRTAVKKAGLKPARTKRKPRVWTRDKILGQIIEKSSDGVAPSSEQESTLANAARRWFDSWQEACREAGVEPQKKIVSERREWTEEKVIDRIKELSDDGVAPRTDRDRGVYNAALRRFGDWETACRKAGVRPLSRERATTKEELLEELREHAEDGVAPSTDQHKSLQERITRRFNSWQEACDRAGLTSRGEIKNWDREELIKRLREDSEGGIAPFQTYVEYGRAAIRKFGNWRKACEEAGVEPKIKGSWSKEEILKEMREQATDGVAPRTDQIEYYIRAVGIFGSWEEACREAGLTPRSETRKKYTKEKILELLKEDSKDGIAPPAKTLYYEAARREFGDWEVACQKAGVVPRSDLPKYSNMSWEWNEKWNRSKIIEQLEKDATDGIAPVTRKVAYSQAALHYFDSWEEACEAAGVTPASECQIEYTREKVIKTLREQSRGKIAPPTDGEMKSCYGAAVRLFGSWKKACEAAGVTPRSEVSREETKKLDDRED